MCFFDWSVAKAVPMDPAFLEVSRKLIELYLRGEQYAVYLAQWQESHDPLESREFSYQHQFSSELANVSPRSGTQEEAYSGKFGYRFSKEHGPKFDFQSESTRESKSGISQEDLIKSEVSVNLFQVFLEDMAKLSATKQDFEAATKRARLIQEEQDRILSFFANLTEVYTQICKMSLYQDSLNTVLESLEIVQFKAKKNLVSEKEVNKFLAIKNNLERKIQKSQLEKERVILDLAKNGSALHEYMGHASLSKRVVCNGMEPTPKGLEMSSPITSATALRYASLYGIRALDAQEEIDRQLRMPELRPFVEYKKSTGITPEHKVTYGLRLEWKDLFYPDAQSQETYRLKRSRYLSMYSLSQWRERMEGKSLVSLRDLQIRYAKQNFDFLQQSTGHLKLVVEQFKFGLVPLDDWFKALLDHSDNVEDYLDSWKRQAQSFWELKIQEGIGKISGTSLFLNTPFSFGYLIK
jgi:hypothetical protein